jgi:hypothetical protein
MASIVSAGTTSATALNMSADTTGILQLASNNGTVALTVGTSQNVGIGLTSPSYRLDISEAGITTTTTPTVRVGGTRNMFLQPTLGSFGIYGPAIGFGAYFDTSASPPVLVMQAGRLMQGGSAIAGTGDGQIDFYAYRDASYNTAVSVNANSVLRARVDNNGDFLFNSGYGSVATAYGCRAWVNFNGTGTVAIRASGNVSSITDNAVGNYTINFTTALPDGNYAVGSSFQRFDETGQFLNVGFSNGTASFSIEAFRAAGNTNTAVLTDFATLSLVVMR